MKKIVLLGVFIASLTTLKSQISLSAGAGISSLKCPTMGLGLQGQIGKLILGAGFDHHISAKVVNGTYYWAKIGSSFKVTDLNSIQVSTGFGSYQRSRNVKSMNEGLALLNAQFIHQMKYHPEAAWFGSITGTKRFVIVSAGLRFTFGRGQQRGCPSTW